MNEPTFIEVTHNTLTTKVYIYIPNIFSFYFSEAHKATLLLATGGAMIPVKESPDEVTKKVLAARLQVETNKVP